MTQEKEALKLALESLERSVATCFDQRSHDAVMGRPEHFVNQAITAIKEALAQPEQIPPSAYSNTHQPEREPVQTTPNFAQLKQILDNLDRCHHRDSKQEFLRTWIRDWTEHKLTKHTTPPPRKPLTDEQIDEIYFKSSLEVDNRCEDIYDFVRAIEAAHNIKE